jgi:hypothetical protein
MIRIIGSNPGDTDTQLSFLSLVALMVIYWLMGVVMSFCAGVCVGSTIVAIRALFNLFRSRTAWFALLTFLVLAHQSVSLGWGFLPIAGDLGDRTGYHAQSALLVGAVFPGLFLWFMPIGLFAVSSKELVESSRFRDYAYIYGAIVYYMCGCGSLIMIGMYLVHKVSIGWLLASLILYPITFFVAPLYMGFCDGIWWPLVLNYGGLILGSVFMSLWEYRTNAA